MSSVVIAGDTSGSVTLSAPATAGSTTLTLPATTGNVIIDTATQTLTNKTISSPLTMGTSVITSGTAVASTSGTNIDFTSIPSWVKRITVMLSGVTWSTAQQPRVQIGTGGTPTTTGYVGQSAAFSGAGTGVNTLSAAFDIGNSGSGVTTSHDGQIIISNLTGNTWTCQAIVGQQTTRQLFCAGSVTLSGVLNIVRVTSISGGTFNAGSINILYE